MLGKRLKQLRLERNLTLEKLAETLNIKYPNTVSFNKGKLSKWENGKEEPKLSSVRILTDFYGITIDDLYSSGNSDKSNIITIYNQLNEQNKKATYDFAKQKLDEQNSNIPFGLPIKEETNKALHTIAAHSDNPNRVYTEEEIEKIDTYLDKEKKKYTKMLEKYNKK